MKRLLYSLVIGLVIAGIVHIVVILIIPSYAARDAWTKLATAGGSWQFTVVAQGNQSQSILPLVDPSFSIAACRYDLSEAPLQVTAEGELAFWSVAIFDRRGNNIFSFNDRTAVEGQLSLLVMNPVQRARLRKDAPDLAKDAVVVETSVNRGFVLIRALVEDESWRGTVERFLRDAKCERFVIEAEAQG